MHQVMRKSVKLYVSNFEANRKHHSLSTCCFTARSGNLFTITGRINCGLSLASRI